MIFSGKIFIFPVRKIYSEDMKNIILFSQILIISSIEKIMIRFIFSLRKILVGQIIL